MKNIEWQILDYMVLERALTMLRAYFGKQKEILSDYQKELLSLHEVWDDEGYEEMCQHIAEMKSKFEDHLDVIQSEIERKIDFQIQHIKINEGIAR